MRGFAAIALGLAGVSTAQAQPPATDCAASNGQYDEQYIKFLSVARHVSGEIVFHRADFSERWSSMTQFMFEDFDPETWQCNCAGVRVSAYQDSPEALIVELVNKGQAVGEEGNVPRDKPVTFDMQISDDNMLTLKIGTGFWTTNVGDHVTPGTAKLTCSGIAVTFQNIVDHTDPFRVDGIPER
jgi:hypothetical protein